MSRLQPLLRRTIPVIALGAASVLLLSACSVFFPGGTTPPSADSASPTGTATTSATPTETATATSAPPTQTAVPIALACDQLWTSDQVYSFNPNFGPNPSYATAAGSLAAQVITASGVACGWASQSDGGRVEIAVAKPSPDDYTLYSGQAAEKSRVVPTYGTDAGTTGYFSADTGTAQVFTNGYWIVVDSNMFQEPGDAEEIVADVEKNLP
ncbi:hypothetical protein [Gryllotalpicola sp.]|uniref:hypothetical protein n=1 Tax=Gryllotalpicola sp. TaxID=1932787 RepID=UPI00260FDB41|nr:hypothetical protein [Gryllotalpicola sp.]